MIESADLNMLLLQPASARVRPGTVGWFALELRKDAKELLEQLSAAGVPKEDAKSALTEQDKQKFLAYLQASHGTDGVERKCITLVKKAPHERSQAPREKVSKRTVSSRCNRVIIVGNFGRQLESFESYELTRRNGSTATFSQGKVGYELLRAFHFMRFRYPDRYEQEILDELSNRLGQQLVEMPHGRMARIFAALTDSLVGFGPLYRYVLHQAIYALTNGGRLANELALSLFVARYAKDVPVSQQGLHVGSGRGALASMASMAWRLLRLKHFLPASVATISLA